MKTALRSLVAALIALPLLLVAAPDAEAKLAFFRNYPDLKWNVIKTEHFNVFYPISKDPDSEHYIDTDFTARKVAYVAEEMYPLVCGQFNYYIDETVNIVMLDQTDDLTGYTVPSFDWIVVSGRHSDLLWRLRGHHDWLRNVMYHEYAHVVSLKADHVFSEEAFGASVGVRWNDGRINTSASASAFVMKGDPWFWVEGGAEYYTDVAGINSWTSNRDMRMRVDILEDMALNFDDMGDYFGSNGGFDGNRHYLSGYSFALYLEERFGEGVYQSFGLNREKQGWTPNFLTVIEDTLNISADQLYEDWQAWAMSKYEKVRDDVMVDPAMGSRVHMQRKYWESDEPESVEHLAHIRTFKGGDKYKWRKDREKTGIYAWSPRYTDDGGKWGKSWLGYGAVISYVSEQDYPVFNPDQPYRDNGEAVNEAEHKAMKEPLALGAFEGDGHFDFSPDGNKVVLPCPEDMPRNKAEAKAKVHRVNADGWNWHTLCMVDLEEVERESRELMVDHFGYDPMERDAERLEMIRRNIEPPEDKDLKKTGAKWKRRTWINWAESDDYLIDYKRLGAEPIRRVSYPAWSPDGNTIAYVRYEDASQELWLLDLSTEQTKQITNFDDGTHFEGLDWSPDGTQLVTGVYRYNMADIYVFDTEGNGRPLTMDRFEDRGPHWGHDGNIYFTSDRVDSIFNVFRINPRLDPGRLDRDLDGILDADDACPDERETRNLFRDSDGCPDQVPVRVTADAIEIGEKVFFELDKAIIKAESFELLDAVARVINDNPQIIKIEIAGHTDSQGDEEYNLELSERRAAAVVGYLTGKGVSEERVGAVGYGQSKPLVEEDTEDAFAANRRVEFLILEQEEVTEIVEQGSDNEGAASYACGQGPDAELLENAYLVQVTNTWTGAFTPWLTPSGHLFYSNYTAWGWKDWGLNCSEFHNKVVDDTSLVIAEADYGLDVPQEVYPDYTAMTQAVPVHSAFWHNPIIIPIIQVGNTSLSHVGIDIGVYFSVTDVLDTNEVMFYGQVGERLIAQLVWTNKRFWPEFTVFAFAQSIKFDYGYNMDDDGDLRTEDDQFLADIKLGYGFIGGGVGVLFPIAQNMSLELNTFHYGIAIQGVDDGKRYQPIVYRNLNELSFDVVSARLARAFRYGSPANPRGGRGFSFSWSPNYTVPLNSSTGGVSADDGQVFDKYFFNEFQFLYSEYISLPVKKPNGESAEHTLQLNFQVGLIDRNVPYGDEIRGGSGGQIFRSNPYQSMTAFAGYGPYTLSGESVGLVNIQYRFPLARNIDAKAGIAYLESIYLQVFGTVGNFWSYRVKDGSPTTDLYGERVLADEEARQGGGLDQPGSGIVREWPGMVASENGWPVLADVGVEARFSMNLFNRASWYSSIRIAYGFMGVTGRGDVDGDDVYTNSSDPTLDNRSNEKEPAGFRFMIGIGSGW
jgi:outer membrane protein OmpA-like peptidoglycan-associated protein